MGAGLSTRNKADYVHVLLDVDSREHVRVRCVVHDLNFALKYAMYKRELDNEVFDAGHDPLV
jgi:ABC-type cobalamin/Fe3+-siderophores transport system ATPase subunit